MTSGSGIEDAGFLDRLQLIEAQPIEERASAFALLHDELREALDAADRAAGAAARASGAADRAAR